MAWNEFSGCGRPYRLDFDALLARTATDADMLEAVTTVIRNSVAILDPKSLAGDVIAVVLKQLGNESFG